MKKTLEKIVIGLETAIDGGSISILKNQTEIGFANGDRGQSKSEDILILLDELLRKNDIKKENIGLLAVSCGPGSLTGIRIGRAIAKGIRDSLNTEVLVVSVLEAMVGQACLEKKSLSALYTQKSRVFSQVFRRTEIGGQTLFSGEEIYASNLYEFVEKVLGIERRGEMSLILTEALVFAIEEKFGKPIADVFEVRKIVCLKGSFARIIGLTGELTTASDNESEVVL